MEDRKIIEYTMGIGRVNLLALLFILPILLVFLTPYILIWGGESIELGKNTLSNNFFLVLIGGIVLHELLHGITWAFFTKKGMKSIKFGFKLLYLTPYCHCKEPLKVKHYRLGGAMPLIVMGLIPALLAIAIGNGFLLVFGIFFTWTAGGDIITLYMLSELDKEMYVSDHPHKMGFYREIDTVESN